MAPLMDPTGSAALGDAARDLLRELTEDELLELQGIAGQVRDRLRGRSERAARYVEVAWLRPATTRHDEILDQLEAVRIDLEANGHEVRLGAYADGCVVVGTRSWCSCGWSSHEQAPSVEDDALHRRLGDAHRIDHDGGWGRG